MYTYNILYQMFNKLIYCMVDFIALYLQFSLAQGDKNLGRQQLFF